MTDDLLGTLYWTYFALGLASPLLPFTLMWRTACLSAGALLAANLFAQPVHWSDENVSHTFGLLMLLMFTSVVVLALAVRFLIVVAKGPATDEVLGIGQYSHWRIWIDLINLAFWGGIAGVFLVILLARLLGGLQGGHLLDLGIALAGVAVAVFAALRCSKMIAVPLSSIGIAVSVLSFIGSGQTDRIIGEAEALAAGRPWCLVTPTTDVQQPTLAALGFFSLPKGRLKAHLVLRIRDGDEDIKAHWSIRQQRFFNGAYNLVPACDYRTDYAAALMQGRV
ncbi:hypothetical protein ABID21_001920 [Pseudorhizobium tarimense]|uniref:Uncharacterized protein n=1 Tax=Pseudorhizobium tarimense TaxID=1079109 RepID=A0ABV2H5P8_9HYPH|nr:hypothetical protein [Pseudorhizobium tarimense]MCJ8519013.1 hypothetical protein [Pseudorhizobium tarimense]